MWKLFLLILAGLYTLNPYDILPDLMVGWGWLDDLIIWILLWRYFVSLKKKVWRRRPLLSIDQWRLSTKAYRKLFRTEPIGFKRSIFRRYRRTGMGSIPHTGNYQKRIHQRDKARIQRTCREIPSGQIRASG